MRDFKCISAEQTKALIDQGNVTLVDIRDEVSYQSSHILDAQHLVAQSIETFMETADKQQPLVVYCFHGNASQSAARFMVEKGFQDVTSLDGGFEGWRCLFPDYCT